MQVVFSTGIGNGNSTRRRREFGLRGSVLNCSRGWQMVRVKMLSGFNSIPYCCFHWLGLLEISNFMNTGDTTTAMPICGSEVTILIYLSFSHLRVKKLTPGFFGLRNEGFEVGRYNHFSSTVGSDICPQGTRNHYASHYLYILLNLETTDLIP